MATYSVNWSAVLSSVSGAVGAGVCLVQNSAGTHLAGTTANRANYGRCVGIAASAGDGDGDTPTVRMIEAGPVPASITGLAVGTVSWVRVSATGTLERVTPGVGDDIIGKAHADGSVQLSPGVWDSTNFSGGGGGGDASYPIVLTTDVSGILPEANGGTGIAALASGVATFLGTPSGANLAAALTTALPDTKGGTGLTSLASGIATFLGTPSGANLASALTTALPDTKGGTGLTALGSGVATFLGTPSSANLAAAVTDETGSGALVFATSPTLTTPVINGQNQGPAVAVQAMDIGWTGGAVFTKTLAAGANTFTFSGQASGMCIIVRVTGAASTLTWPTVRWAGGTPPTQTASGTDVYTFVHDGTNIYGSVVQAMA